MAIKCKNHLKCNWEIENGVTIQTRYSSQARQPSWLFNWQRRDSTYCSNLSNHLCQSRVGALSFIMSWCYIFVWRFFPSTISAWGSSLLLWLPSKPPTGVHCRLVMSTLTLDQQFVGSQRWGSSAEMFWFDWREPMTWVRFTVTQHAGNGMV